MVLHNNKWDRKARRAYERKHGITGAQPEVPKTRWSRHDEPRGTEEPDDQAPTSGDESSAAESDVDPDSLDAKDNVEAVFENLYEVDAEQEQLIAEHLARARQTRPEQTERKSHIIVSNNAKEFEEIERAAERGKLGRNIRRRFGVPPTQSDLPEDDGFDSFMDEVVVSKHQPDEQLAPVALNVDAEQQKWLDSLLD